MFNDTGGDSINWERKFKIGHFTYQTVGSSQKVYQWRLMEDNQFWIWPEATLRVIAIALLMASTLDSDIVVKNVVVKIAGVSIASMIAKFFSVAKSFCAMRLLKEQRVDEPAI